MLIEKRKEKERKTNHRDCCVYFLNTNVKGMDWNRREEAKGKNNGTRNKKMMTMMMISY